MRIKLIKSFKLKNLTGLPKGDVLQARLLRSDRLGDIFPRVQILEGRYSGEFIPREYFIQLPEEKTYSEEQWNDMENYYMNLLDKEREKTKTAQDKYNNLLKALNKHFKNYLVASQVSEMLNEWLDADYVGSEENDRKNFSIKLTNFIQEKLV